MSLDLIDRKLLYALDTNARASLSSLATQIGVHRNVALYRFDRLRKEGIINGFFTEINPLALGLKIYRVFFSLGVCSDAEKIAFHEHIMQTKEVIWYFDVEGTWDKDVIYAVPSENDFFLLFRNLLNRFNRIIKKHNISFMIQLHHFPKDYLIAKGRVVDQKIFKYTAAPDEEDTELLRILAENASIPFATLAQKADMSVNTLKEHLRKLQKNGTILGFRPFINTNKTGYVYYRLHFDLKNYGANDFSRLKSYLHSLPNVIYDVEYINGADIEIEVHLQGQTELKNLKDAINKEFGHIIDSLYSMEFTKEWIYRYFPG